MYEIVWGSKFHLNIKIVDDQHMQLVKIFNTLQDAMKEGKGKDAVADTVLKLLDYVTYHFATEEELFIKYRYPQYEEHKYAHDCCRKKIELFKKHLEEGRTTVAVDVSIFLHDWIVNHLLEMDKDYAPYLISKGAS